MALSFTVLPSRFSEQTMTFVRFECTEDAALSRARALAVIVSHVLLAHGDLNLSIYECMHVTGMQKPHTAKLYNYIYT